MKKIIAITLIILTAIALCSCTFMYDKATDFSAKEIKNYNNNNKCGRYNNICFKDNTLYVLDYYEIPEDTVNRLRTINENGVSEKTLSDYNGEIMNSGSDVLYVNDDKVQTVPKFSKVEPISKYLKKHIYDEDTPIYYTYIFDDKYYVAKDYVQDIRRELVYIDEKGKERVIVKDFSDVTYNAGNLYFVSDEVLYKTDTKNFKSQRIAKVGVVDYIAVNDDYLYYIYEQQIIKRCNLKNGKVEEIAKLKHYGNLDTLNDSDFKGMSINCYKDKAFYLDDGDLYSINKDGSTDKLGEFETDEIYIFDEKWIYMMVDYEHVVRVSQDGKIKEIVR